MAQYLEKAKTMTNDELKDAMFIINMIDTWNDDNRMEYAAYSIELANRRNNK